VLGFWRRARASSGCNGRPWGWGFGPSPPPPPTSDEDAFRRLVSSGGKRTAPPSVPKFIKKLEEIPEIALPETQPVKIALALAERGLVGQFMGLWPSAKTTDDWIQRNWKPLLKHGVTCYPVGRGFFIFEFIDKEDRDLIFRSGSYFMGTQGLYLNRWTPDFDPNVDSPKEVPVWVRLPNLPVHCWSYESLQKIGNGIGHFIDKADTKVNYTCARICVEVDLEAGLPEAVKLSVGSWSYYQKVDYEHLPFKCRNCQEHGHFQRNCPKAQTPDKEDIEGWQKVKRNKAAQKPREKRPEEETGQPSSSTPVPQAPPPPPRPNLPLLQPLSRFLPRTTQPLQWRPRPQRTPRNLMKNTFQLVLKLEQIQRMEPQKPVAQSEHLRKLQGEGNQKGKKGKRNHTGMLQ
jgi:hypothetical protein